MGLHIGLIGEIINQLLLRFSDAAKKFCRIKVDYWKRSAHFLNSFILFQGNTIKI